jgi:hypothetical protein
LRACATHCDSASLPGLKASGTSSTSITFFSGSTAKFKALSSKFIIGVFL